MVDDQDHDRACACSLLADRGEIDLDAPVARYWPEFAAAGKEGVLVRHVMAHTAGLAGLGPSRITVEDLSTGGGHRRCWPRRRPGGSPAPSRATTPSPRATCWASSSQRVTGASLGTFFREEVAGPLGADFHIGTGPELDPRVATIEPPSGPLGGVDLTDDGSIPARALRNPVVEATIPASPSSAGPRCRPATATATPARSPRCRPSSPTAARPAGSGCSASRPRAHLRGAVRRRRPDPRRPDRLGIGFGISGPEVPVSPNPRACYWGGWGGSIVVNDLDARTTFAYGMNRMGDGLDSDQRALMLLLGFFQSRAATPG